MKRKDPRLLNECKDKVIPLLHALSADNPPDTDVFELLLRRLSYIVVLPKIITN